MCNVVSKLCFPQKCVFSSSGSFPQQLSIFQLKLDFRNRCDRPLLFLLPLPGGFQLGQSNTAAKRSPDGFHFSGFSASKDCEEKLTKKAKTFFCCREEKISRTALNTQSRSSETFRSKDNICPASPGALLGSQTHRPSVLLFQLKAELRTLRAVPELQETCKCHVSSHLPG